MAQHLINNKQLYYPEREFDSLINTRLPVQVVLLNYKYMYTWGGEGERG